MMAYMKKHRRHLFADGVDERFCKLDYLTVMKFSLSVKVFV